MNRNVHIFPYRIQNTNKMFVKINKLDQNVLTVHIIYTKIKRHHCSRLMWHRLIFHFLNYFFSEHNCRYICHVVKWFHSLFFRFLQVKLNALLKFILNKCKIQHIWFIHIRVCIFLVLSNLNAYNTQSITRHCLASVTLRLKIERIYIGSNHW